MTEMEMQVAPRVAVIMGSKSDWATIQRAAEMLAVLFEYVGAVEARGIQVIIAGAHLSTARSGPRPGARWGTSSFSTKTAKKTPRSPKPSRRSSSAPARQEPVSAHGHSEYRPPESCVAGHPVLPSGHRRRRAEVQPHDPALGNFFTIREILKKYDAEVVRLFILRAHYRSPLNYSDIEKLDNASYEKSIIEIDTILKSNSKATIFSKIRSIAIEYRSFKIASDIYKKIYSNN